MKCLGRLFPRMEPHFSSVPRCSKACKAGGILFADHFPLFIAPMFEQTFKNRDDILRKDAGCSSELDKGQEQHRV